MFSEFAKSPIEQLLVGILCSTILMSCSGLRQVNPTAFGNLGPTINSSSDDYAPVLRDSATLIFTSNRKPKEELGLKELLESKSRSTLYMAMRLGKEWDEAQKFEILFGNGSSDNMGSITFAPLPNKLDVSAYFTACDRPDGIGGCDIYMVSGQETDIVSLAPALNSEKWDGHPFVSNSGSKIWFASEREGGYGGSDIWYADRNSSGLWDNPINAGPGVNGTEDELTPFFDEASETLYFVSETSRGDYELFAKKDGDARRASLPPPYNTLDNEFSPFIIDGKLYLASDRDGGCGDLDLYAFPIERNK